MKTRAAAGNWLVASLLLLVAGCATVSDSTTEFFLLNGTSSAADSVQLKPFRLGLGPVELAPYLDQEGIAIHEQSNRIDYAVDQRWAEPLESNVSRVLLSNLTVLLPNQTVYPFPWRVAQAPDYQIRLNVNRFGWFPDNQVRIEARVAFENSEGEIMFSNEENMGMRAAGTDYESSVAAQNALLDQFSKRLVEILRRQVES